MSEKIERRIQEINTRILDLKDRVANSIVTSEINKTNKCIKSLSKEREKLFKKLENKNG